MDFVEFPKIDPINEGLECRCRVQVADPEAVDADAYNAGSYVEALTELKDPTGRPFWHQEIDPARIGVILQAMVKHFSE